MVKKSILSSFVAVGALMAASSASAIGAVSTQYLNMRSAPSAYASKVTVIPSGSALDVKHCLSNRPWCAVSYGANKGWASARFIDAKTPESIPLVHAPARAKMHKVYYKTVKAPAIRTERVIYRQEANTPYEPTYIRPTSTSSTEPAFVRIISAPFKAAGSLISAPFKSREDSYVREPAIQTDRSTAAPTYVEPMTQDYRSVRTVSYKKPRVQHVFVEQSVQPIYVKELPRKEVKMRKVAYIMQPEIVHVYTKQKVKPQKVSYIAHPNVQHIAIKEPQMHHSTAYIEKAPIKHVAYRTQHHHITREYAIQPRVEHVSYRPHMTHTYTQKVVMPTRDIHKQVYHKPYVGQVYHKPYIERVTAYNPSFPDTKVTHNEFHRNETRYDKIGY